MITKSQLDRSYEYCRHVAKTQARNFYYSFTVLPPEKKAAMCAIYAFMRYCDDITDGDSQSADMQARLDEWRKALDRTFDGNYGDSLILPAFHDVTIKYRIPSRFFYDVIDGAEMDLSLSRYETFDDLRQYCYKVAGVVGFVCIHVWGFTGGDDIYIPAEACGLAFQLTNILRDVREDAKRGRIYLPLEDIRRFGLTEADILQEKLTQPFMELMRFEVDRAKEYYHNALPLLDRLEPDSRSTFVIMFRIYRGLLDKIEAHGYDVFSSRARLSAAEKVGIVAQTWLGSRFRCGDPLLKI
jgi:phytoene synthase